LPANFKNYIRPSGLQKLKDELLFLLDVDRPAVVKVVSWAASNGDRSENGDYLYGKKRLREIDRRIRFLTKRIDSAVVVDPTGRENADQVFFGATVTYTEPDGTARTVTIVGVDEIDSANGYVSWISPVATALIKAREGDQVQVRAPHGNLLLEIDSVVYSNNA
jgi:transcription elongation factor GreB